MTGPHKIPKQPPPPSVTYDAVKRDALVAVQDAAQVHENKMAMDSEYRREYLEQERRERETEVDAERAALRDKLVRRGCPVRLLDPIVAGSLQDTPPMKYVEAWIGGEPRPTFLVLSGSKGVGKTTAAAWASQHMGALRWVRAGELATIGLYDRERFDPIANARTLVLDDLGTEFNDAKGAFRALFDLLINTRYDGMLRTIITTNLLADGFTARYGARVLDRINEAGLWANCGREGLR